MELVLEESRILHQSDLPASMADLESKITVSRKGIGKDWLVRYDRLRRNGLGVAAEHGGVCNACHLNVNVGDLNRMRRGEMAWICPHCARFLLLEEPA